MKKTKKLYIFINNFSQAFNSKNVPDYAASTAFFMFLSLIPFMMVAFAVMPYTFVTEEMLLSVIMRVIPEAADTFIVDIIQEIYDSSAGIITVSIIVTLWSAGKAMQALIRGLNVVYDIRERRNFILLRILGCVYTIALMIAIVIMIGILMFGRTIVNFFFRHMPDLEPMRSLILRLRYPVSLVLLILLFTAIYCMVPSIKQKFTMQLPGAVFAAIAWSAGSWVFSFYLNHFDGFSTYGSLATVIIVMLYMYMMMYIILVGAYINCWLGRVVKMGKNSKRV
ncbi:MAG: YihY/virulence factor BrkB family protein [Lachnospiraceae bacterium]|nr:YihY/virulence factor BrkB family protein [Lachnospiraceae bacterium]